VTGLRLGAAGAVALLLGGEPAPSADTAALGALTRAFFAAYARKDVEAFSILWSPKSPDLDARRQALQRLVGADGLLLGAVDVRDVAVVGDEARVRARVEMSATSAGGSPSSPLTPNRILHLVKEGGAWKVWRERSTEEEVAERLLAVSSEPEREAVLSANPELERAGLRNALLARADQLAAERSYARAQGVNELVLRIARQGGDALGEVLALNGVGVTCLQQDEYEAALEHLREAVVVGRRVGDRLTLARVLNNLGRVHTERGEHEEALERYEESLKLAAALGNKRGQALLYTNIGIAHRRRGNYALALENYERALVLEEALGSEGGVAGVLNNIGLVHADQRNPALALEFLQRSLALKEKSGDKASLVSALNNIGMVHRQQGRLDLALDFYGRSRELAESLGDRDALSTTLHNAGELLEVQAEHEGALAYYQKALALKEALGDRDGLANTLNHMARVRLAQGAPAEALAFAERAAAMARSTGSGETLWEALTTTGLSERALGRPDRARLAFADAVAGVESIRAQVAGSEQERGGFFEARLTPYQAMVDLLASGGRGSEALIYAERARARVLLDVLRGGRVALARALTAEEREEERRLNGRLLSLNARVSREQRRAAPDAARLIDLTASLEKARLEQEAFRSRLYAAHPELRTRRGEDSPLGIAEVAHLVPDTGTALLEYVVGDEATHLLVLVRDEAAAAPRLEMHRLDVERAELARRAESFRERIARRDLASAEESGALYDLLLGPARATLGPRRRLVIVPDGPLWDLPFQALRSPTRRYVIEDQAVSYAPSLTALVQMVRRRSRPAGRASTLLAFADPGRLPETARQVRELKRLYGVAASRVYVGPEAREDRMKAEAGGYRILHFATHGILNDASPLYSYLLLASGRESSEDGRLEAREILDLDLTAELAVLSACETARGRVASGEGVIGLTWAFFVAGCPSIVVSQWKVDSASTTELMLEFHRGLRAGRAKDESLRAAALKFLRGTRYRHPFYWAGFVVVGDSG
jgi:CHAT domain-containing protein/tetratricopeptide (TPR) repeat protein